MLLLRNPVKSGWLKKQSVRRVVNVMAGTTKPSPLSPPEFASSPDPPRCFWSARVAVMRIFAKTAHSLWTVAGRKHISYTEPDTFKERFAQASEIDSVTVIARDGKLYGRVVLTWEVPEPQGVMPVGIDLNETNALVAVDADDRELFITGHSTKILNKRTARTVGRLQQKLATRKAEDKDTHSVVRTLKPTFICNT